MLTPVAATPVAAAWRKWQRAIEKYANPLIKPSTAKRYYREARKARLEYNSAYASSLDNQPFKR